jgi:ribonucleoside-triphosphate reductase (thioredoxin)
VLNSTNNTGGEIILRNAGLCNLSEVVVRSTDSLEELKNKVEVATILGTFQSTLTNFRYLRPVWKNNAEEERLLGVSLTGIMDHPVLSDTEDYYVSGTGEAPKNLATVLVELKKHAIETNVTWAKLLGISPSMAITTVKPSGTVSQLVDSSSGIHPRYSNFYVRTVRNDKKDPLTSFLIQQNVPYEEDITKSSNIVFSFPQKAPSFTVTRDKYNAIQQLEHYLMYADYWCEHNPSITVYVKEHEWIEVAAWCYAHFNKLGGVSFLPHSDHIYKQAPYQEITEEVYNEMLAKMPTIDWSLFKETEDNATGYREYACVSGVCEI